MKFKSSNFVLFILIIFFRCQNTHSINTEIIKITELTIQDSIAVNNNAAIHVSTEATNGCWQNLQVLLSKKADYKFNLTGYGTCNNCNGPCPDVLVSKDTLINMTFNHKGNYIFNANENSRFSILTDTIIVY